MYIVMIALQILTIGLIAGALGLLLKGDGFREQKMMCQFLTGAMVLNAGYLLELTCSTREAAIVATKIQYVGSTFIPIFYAWFMFIYCREKVPHKIIQLFVLLDFLLLAMIFTCERHTFFYRRINWVEGKNGHFYLSLTYNAGFTAYFLIAYVIPYLVSLYALLRGIFLKPGRPLVRRYQGFLILSLLPMLAVFTYVWKVSVQYDFAPAILGITLSVVVVLVWKRRNYDFSRLAAELVLKSMDDGVIMLDADRRIVNYNEAAAEIFTELSFQAVGDRIEEMEDFPEGMLDQDAKRNFSLNGHYYESHMRRIENEDGNKGYVIIIFDVTETRNYIEEIKRVREEAERANQAKSEFLANMSHEIRTPMNAVMGLSDIIMEESRGRKVYGYACDIKAASQNLLAIINDILDLSKVEAGKMELIPQEYYLKGVVDEVVNMMHVAATQRGLLLKCEFSGDIPCKYYGDDTRIKQILINIMNNAVKFTKEGSVKIFVGGYPGSADDMENLVFRIQDTGIGIKQENLEKIFEDFKQVDSGRNRGVEGTGLGLSITRHFIQMMKGSIEVESVYGEGSTFIVTLPQKIVDYRTLDEMPEVPKQVSDQEEAFVVEGYKVLVVDDNLINRKVATGFLKTYGFDLFEAESGPEAIRMVRSQKFNLIFMDHMMPEMDGIEATRIIREECGENGRSPVIIALTANAMAGVREKFLNSGFQDFIPKPLDRKPLNEVLSRWIPNELKQPVKRDSGAVAFQPGISFSDIYIDGIDIEEAKKHHTGQVEDYLSLLELYCLDGKRKHSCLTELLGQENYKDYGIEVHGLKSASANIGAMELSTQAREQEEAATRGDTDFIKRHSPELLLSYDWQIKAIQKFLDKRHAVDERSREDEDVSLDPEALIGQLKSALEKLEDFKSKDCARIIEGLLRYHHDSMVDAKLKEIQEQLRMYEDDAAESLIRDMIDWLEKEE